MKLDAIHQLIEIMKASGKLFTVTVDRFELIPVVSKKTKDLTFMIKLV